MMLQPREIPETADKIIIYAQVVTGEYCLCFVNHAGEVFVFPIPKENWVHDKTQLWETIYLRVFSGGGVIYKVTLVGRTNNDFLEVGIEKARSLWKRLEQKYKNA